MKRETWELINDIYKAAGFLYKSGDFHNDNLKIEVATSWCITLELLLPKLAKELDKEAASARKEAFIEKS